MSAPHRDYEDVVPERQRRLAGHLGIKEAIFYAGRRATESLPKDPGVVPYASTNGNGNGRPHASTEETSNAEPSSSESDE